MTTSFKVDGVDLIGSSHFLIAGPCVIERESYALKMADATKAVADKLKVSYIFKASYDKANRTSLQSFRSTALGLLHPLTVR